LTHNEKDGFGDNEEEDSRLIGMQLLSTRQRWEEDFSDKESGFEYELPLLRNSRGLLEGVDLEEVKLPPNMDTPFEWEAPDLKYGLEWCEARLDNLRTITQGWYDQYDVMVEGRRILVSHRLN
jgi:hypothetical protein